MTRQNEDKNDVKLGRFISMVLRHHPESIGISLDEHGYAKVEELLSGMNHVGKKIDREILERIVENNDKNRYSFSLDKKKIRANQGHSIRIDLELKEQIPPQFLYHGTATRFTGSIFKEGLTKQSRQHVHLSSDIETATKVGSRHGIPVVLKILALEMHQKGYSFYLSENQVWLTEFVPKEYIVKLLV